MIRDVHDFVFQTRCEYTVIRKGKANEEADRGRDGRSVSGQADWGAARGPQTNERGQSIQFNYCKNASGVATFLHVLCCIFEKFISYSPCSQVQNVDVCQLQRHILELFISYYPTVLTVAEHHKAFHTSSNVICLN